MNLSKLDVRLDPFNANLIHTAPKLVIRSSGEDAQKSLSVGYIPQPVFMISGISSLETHQVVYTMRLSRHYKDSKQRKGTVQSKPTLKV